MARLQPAPHGTGIASLYRGPLIIPAAMSLGLSVCLFAGGTVAHWFPGAPRQIEF